ncbi:hypothetical protein HPB52_020955 [Rhipicephalus sanguineus]|uniref:CCHC-type domain-containing protein n=1 Tax=Rhipicephalus sanguineus TaxID=34632 RepID=A0A9D4PQH3_RHISA|nr:hypothetical protein HPB52_020955 [Rhipicephalus sanguineus]
MPCLEWQSRPGTVAPVAVCRTARWRPLVSSEMEASARTTGIVDNKMCVQVQGEEITPQNTTTRPDGRSRWSACRGCADGPPPAACPTDPAVVKQARNRISTKTPHACQPCRWKGARPRGGLDIVKTTTVATAMLAAAKITSEESAADTICPNTQQNIMVVSTPNENNAARYATIQEISIQGKLYQVSAYRTAPHDTAKGVIKRHPHRRERRRARWKCCQREEPTSSGRKEDWQHDLRDRGVPGTQVTLILCHLYRKQIDVCHQCGRVGHCKDVCPTPTIKTCLACRLANRKEDHSFTPKCKMCGGEHSTGDRTCKAKYKMPYVVRKRQWLRRQAELQLLPESDFPPLDKPSAVQKSSTPSKNRAPKSRGSSKRSLSKKRSPSHERVGWVDAAKGNNTRSAQKITEATKKDNMSKRPTSSSSETEETSTKNQEAAVEEPALKKRAIEATRKQKENDRNDNLEAKFEARFTEPEDLITVNIAAVTAMKQTVDNYQAENINRFAYIKRTLQRIVSHPTNMGADLGSDHTIAEIGIPEHNDTGNRTHR